MKSRYKSVAICVGTLALVCLCMFLARKDLLLHGAVSGLRSEAQYISSNLARVQENLQLVALLPSSDRRTELRQECTFELRSLEARCQYCKFQNDEGVGVLVVKVRWLFTRTELTQKHLELQKQLQRIEGRLELLSGAEANLST